MHERACGWDNGSVIYDLYKMLLYEILFLFWKTVLFMHCEYGGSKCLPKGSALMAGLG